MNIKALTAAFLASLLMAAGSAYAMDSAAIEEHQKKISQKAEEATTSGSKSRVEALEMQVQELEELIQMMLEEEQMDGAS